MVLRRDDPAFVGRFDERRLAAGRRRSVALLAILVVLAATSLAVAADGAVAGASWASSVSSCLCGEDRDGADVVVDERRGTGGGCAVAGTGASPIGSAERHRDLDSGADPGPIVLVGHSDAGAVITNAAAGNPHVGPLVYVAAYALDEGETVAAANSLGGAQPNCWRTSWPAHSRARRPSTRTDTSTPPPTLFPQLFAQDVPAATAAVMTASQRPAAALSSRDPVRGGNPTPPSAAGRSPSRAPPWCAGPRSKPCKTPRQRRLAGHQPGPHRDHRGRNIATVAVARKLLTLVYYGLRDAHIRALDRPAAA